MDKYPHYLERLQNATRKFWDKAALNSIGGDSFTYGQMATQIEKFHLVFEALGIKKGDKIALHARNGARWGMAYLAVNTYEAVIVPILADFTPESAAFLTNHSRTPSKRRMCLPNLRNSARLSRMPALWASSNISFM